MNIRPKGIAIAMPLLLSLTIGACGNNETEDATIPTNAKAALLNYSNIVHASYVDSIDEAKKMDAAINTFITTPTAPNLKAAQDAWRASREPYLQTEVYRFYDGPIDNPDDGPEGLLNAWPLDENYIDYVIGDDASGLVNDSSVTLTAATLTEKNEQGGEKNIATGYHAIEFLLWGQDTDPATAGQRPHTDYLTDGTGTATNQERRGVYLKVVSALLLTHLQQVADAWAPGQDNYRKAFEATTPDEGLRRVLTGMIVLSGFETGGERLQTALDSGEQEDEHSCFSDNTHRDMVQDIVGVQNVWRGVYVKVDGSKIEGTGIKDVVQAVDPDLANKLGKQIDQSVAAAKALKTPFDQEIASDNAEGRARVQALITSLRAQEKLLEEVFKKFKLSIPVTEE